MPDIADIFARLISRIAQIERRADNGVRHGTVHPGSLDAKAGTVRLRIGGTDEKPLLSPPVRYAQHAGALKLHSPPSDGQQMTLISPSGDFKQGLAMPFGWSNQNGSPSDKGDEHVMTFGPYRLKLTKSTLEVTAGTMKTQIDPGYVKARVGSAFVAVRDQQARGGINGEGRFVATSKDASLRFGFNSYIYTNEAGCFSSHPVVIGPPPTENIFDPS